MAAVSTDADLCVIGGGEAGFTAALAGSALGLRVVLAASGEDPCWRNWDVALAVLRRAGQRVRAPTDVRQEAAVEWAAFRADLRHALEAAAPDRRLARLGAMNVKILRGRATFRDPLTVSVGAVGIRARRFLIATGATASEAAHDGRTLTFETLCRSREVPDSLVVDGGDPQPVALAQGLRRLGTPVTLHTPGGLLPELDQELTRPLRLALERDGVAFAEMPAPPAFDGSAWRHRLPTLPALADLGLDRAGVAVEEGALRLSAALRTTNPRVYAAGAVAGARSTQAAQAQVAVAMRSAFFRFPARYDARLVAVGVVTDPAIAAVGLSEAEARGPVRVWRWPLAETAAGAGGAAEGHLKVVADHRGRIVGAGVVGPDAAEQIGLWALAVRSGTTMAQVADLALPIPALAEASRRAALLHAAQRLQNPWLKRTLALIGRLG